MPRHLISDAHEWINEIPTVPIYCRAVLWVVVRAYLVGEIRVQVE